MSGAALSPPDAVTRVDRLLKQVRMSYPKALRAVGDLRAGALAGGYDWPDWCWTPMGAFHALAGTRPNAAMEIGRTAALVQWELGRGVFVPDEAVVEYAYNTLREFAIAGAVDWHRAVLPPVEVWARLPQPCCYLVVPSELTGLDLPVDVLRPVGVFFHLEHDMNIGRPELRLLLDTDGTWEGLAPVPVYLDRPNLGRAIVDMGAMTDAVAAGAGGVDLRSASAPDAVSQLRGLAVWMVLPFVLALVDPDAAVRDPALPGDAPSAPGQDRQGRWRAASRTRVWELTYRTPGPHLRLV